MAMATSVHRQSSTGNTSAAWMTAGGATNTCTWLDQRRRMWLDSLVQAQAKLDPTEVLSLWNEFSKAESATGIDKAATCRAIEELRQPDPGWADFRLVPIDPELILVARKLISSLPQALAWRLSTPHVVPMTRGRLQLEWYRGSRTLELEFASKDKLHYLKWDSAAGIEEEDVISADDTETIFSLLRWFSSEPDDA